MDGHEFYKYASKVIASGVTIYPKPSNYGTYKIIINRKGRETIGTEYYEDKPTYKKEEIKTPRGIVKTRTLVPSVWDKIFQLYKEICVKNQLINE